MRKSADVFVQNFYRASFSCFWYRIQWNNLALDMDFSKAGAPICILWCKPLVELEGGFAEMRGGSVQFSLSAEFRGWVS